MYSFNGLSNPNNICDTSKIEYCLTCTDSVSVCQICGLILKIGSHYKYEDDEVYICEKCFSNLRCPSICRTCTEEFESRNELFRHLEDNPDHNLDSLTYNFDNGESIDFISKHDYDVFTSPPGTTDTDDYNHIDYSKFLESGFYKRKRFKFKFCIISQHSSVVIKKIESIVDEHIEYFTALSINNGEHFILYDTRKKIGWMPFRNNYIIPISSIILII